MSPLSRQPSVAIIALERLLVGEPTSQSFEVTATNALGERQLAQGLDDETKDRLRIRAAHRRRSMEDETKNILREALARESKMPHDLAAAIGKRFKSLGGVELELPVRDAMREPPQLGE